MAHKRPVAGLAGGTVPLRSTGFAEESLHITCHRSTPRRFSDLVGMVTGLALVGPEVGGRPDYVVSVV